MSHANQMPPKRKERKKGEIEISDLHTSCTIGHRLGLSHKPIHNN